jgi:hypothetical protein
VSADKVVVIVTKNLFSIISSSGQKLGRVDFRATIYSAIAVFRNCFLVTSQIFKNSKRVS